MQKIKKRKVVKMVKRFKNSLYSLAAIIMVLLWSSPVFAEGDPVVTPIGTGSEFATRLHDVAATYFTPLGGIICLLAIFFGGFKILTGAYSPEKRKEAIGGLGYVLLGAIIIGGAMFFAGIFMGISDKFNAAMVVTLVVG